MSYFCILFNAEKRQNIGIHFDKNQVHVYQKFKEIEELIKRRVEIECILMIKIDGNKKIIFEHTIEMLERFILFFSPYIMKNGKEIDFLIAAEFKNIEYTLIY